MEYALVNIVMGDIADIEKKKSMGISSLILGTRGVPIARKDGTIDQEVSERVSTFTNKQWSSGYGSSEGCGFESQCHTLDGHNIFSHIFVIRVVMFV